MGEFTAWLCCMIFVALVSVNNTTFRFDANDAVKMLNEVCSKNGGIEYSKVDIDNWLFTCKDTAKCTVKR
jgi:hypothetical protein